MKSPVNVSEFSDELLNLALDMSLQWGPHWLAPINERVLAAHPQLSPDDAQILQGWCVEAREFAYAEVEKWYPVETENKTRLAMETTQVKYPQINEHNLSHLFNQGMYYAWHG